MSELEDDLTLVWEYLECKVASFISSLFSGVEDSEQDSALSGQTVWDILADVKHPLSRQQIKAHK